MVARVEIDKQETQAPMGRSLFECAEQMNVRVPTSCLKNGKCRECLVEVTEGMAHLSARTPEEEHLTGKFRLSCRARINSTFGQVRCHTLKRQQMKIESTTRGLPTSFQSIPLEPAVVLDGTRILLEGQPIGTGSSVYGLVLDIGTTTVAVRLLDLQAGEIVAASAFENPQRFAGSNVMSRIQYNVENKGRLLQRTLTGYLSHVIEDFQVNPMEICEVVVAANSAMRDIFFGLDVTSIGQKPFHSIREIEVAQGLRETTTVEANARKLRLPINPRARVLGLPIIGCHVGADAAACLLAIDIENQDKPVLLMDIGTNTEILCYKDGKLLVASCPAGPAFEGGSINCGMPGLKGAIEKIEISGSGAVRYQVIDDAAPEGICGSGLVDLLYQLQKSGQLSNAGRLINGSDRFVVDAKAGIYLSEGDISELAQAKGASNAGVKLLLERAGLELSDLSCFYLAGGFARYLDLESARHINLVPNIPDSRTAQIGNAALEGATIALCSLPQRRMLERIVRKAEHLALEEQPRFFDYFVDGCLFTGLAG
jgi:uncharacterized 2Fe-2S/4Fe-4S cluster protein (DUF4445 family)